MLPVNSPNYYCIRDFYASEPVNPFIFATIVTASRNYRFAFANVVIATHEYVMFMSKIDVSQILGSLDGYATHSFGCNYFVFDLVSSRMYK